MSYAQYSIATLTTPWCHVLSIVSDVMTFCLVSSVSIALLFPVGLYSNSFPLTHRRELAAFSCSYVGRGKSKNAVFASTYSFGLQGLLTHI